MVVGGTVAGEAGFAAATGEISHLHIVSVLLLPERDFFGDELEPGESSFPSKDSLQALGVSNVSRSDLYAEQAAPLISQSTEKHGFGFLLPRLQI